MKLAFMKRRYFNQLQSDMDDWVKAGWVTPQSAENILAAQKPTDSHFTFSKIIGIFGAILLGFAALSFVGANWQEMSKFSRIVLLFSVMWAAFGTGWLLEQKKYQGLKEAAFLLGGVLFGVNIALIAQIYHIDRHPPDGFMLWGAGMLLVASVLESRAALAASFLIIAFWTSMETDLVRGLRLGGAIHWEFLILWGLATYLALKMKSIPSYHFSVLSFGYWLLLALFTLTRSHQMSAFSAISSLVLFLMMLTLIALLFTKKEALGVSEVGDDLPRITSLYGIAAMALIPLFTQILLGSRLFRYGLGRPSDEQSYSLWGIIFFIVPVIVAIGWLLKKLFENKSFRLIDLIFFSLIALWCALFIISQYFDWRSVMTFLANPTLFRIFMLAIAIWLVSFGLERHSSKIVNIGLFCFGAEVLYIYAKLFGSLMDTSFFFLIGGIVLMALAFGLEKMRRKLSSSEVSGSEGEQS